MFTDALRQEATALLADCKQKGLTLATAESCTGGLIAALLTDIPGSSAVFERGYVAYSYLSKTELLGVDATLVAASGAVSQQVAAAMAKGALERAHVDIAVAVTGIAGPDGGTSQKPVGLVYIAVATRREITVEKNQFSGDRSEIRLHTVTKALSMLKAALGRDFALLLNYSSSAP